MDKARTSPQSREQLERYVETSTYQWRKPRSTCIKVIPIVLILSLITWTKQSLRRQWSTTAMQQRPQNFEWSSISPSTQLDYYDCYDGLQCARLELPLDHFEPDTKATVALAVIRRPAKVPITSLNYGGAIMTNPGGPGGSGVHQQLSMGEYIQRIVDAQHEPTEAHPGDKYFDIISFDPRGVNHSTPTVACFPDSASRERWDLQAEGEGMLGSSDHALRSNWRRAGALAEGCSGLLMGDGSEPALAEHVNTTPVAMDLLALVERHGEWREAEVRKLRSSGTAVIPSTVARLSWKRGSEKLRYWGFSYGTLLGSTFAAMYPDRIERMVLDGVVDTDDYYDGSWVQNLVDTDKILERFMQYCSNAGPDGCPFWREGGAVAIDAAYEKLLNDIKGDPLAVPGTGSRGPEIISWTDLKLAVKDALYQPLQAFPQLAELMQDVTHGNGSVFADYKTAHRKGLCHAAGQCEVPFSHECVLPGWSPYDAMAATLCTDGVDAGAFSENEFRDYWHGLQNQSRAMGDYWAATKLTCSRWQARAKNRFAGPFAANTSYPLLFVGNSFDPVTPLQNARKMAGQFPGSRVLQQDAEGHCSFASPSLCTAKAVRSYFQHGTLPGEGSVCEPDAAPFIGSKSLMESRHAADEKLMGALEQGSKNFWISHFI